MIKQQAFKNGGRNMLKGALHCHTTRSDGQLTPEELLRRYHEHGYNFVAITDHRIYNYKNFAPDLPLTIIPGMEVNMRIYDHINHEGIKSGSRQFHNVCLGPAKEDGNGFEQDECITMPAGAKTTEFGPQESTIREYQKFLDEIHAKGNLTFYCHPQWSATPVRYFDKQEGNIAIEVRNTTCARRFDMDVDAPQWDDYMRQGKMLYGVAVDDTHAADDLGGAWVMVDAENNVNAILEALKDGRFYSSCGPEIYDFYYDAETGMAVVECSPAAKICAHRAYGPALLVRSEDGNMTRAEFKMGSPGYVRITVTDKDGNRAWTNPIGTCDPWLIGNRE
ncbi:MAG: PHP domain-containing protein [Clostridia bacterium]|nr:PHP domain-containing protein [Clostridia bacterium]